MTKRYADPGPRPARVSILTEDQQIDRARYVKADALARLLVQYNVCKSSDVHLLTKEEWDQVAQYAGVNPPSGLETVAQVEYIMSLLERLKQLQRSIARRGLSYIITPSGYKRYFKRTHNA